MTIDAYNWEFQHEVCEVRWVTQTTQKPVDILVETDDVGEARLRAWIWALEHDVTPEKVDDMEVICRLILTC